VLPLLFRAAPRRPRPAPAGIAVLAALVLLLAGATPAYARKAGIAALGCDGCHQGGKPPTVTLTATPTLPGVGDPVALTVTVSQTNGMVAGFFLTTAFGAGAFKATESGTVASGNGVMHTMPRTGSGGQTTFKAQWTASEVTGVEFQVYALSANGDNTTGGDGAGAAKLPLLIGCGAGHTYYLDQDGDGFGTLDPAYPPRQDCTLPMGYAAMGGDCDDFHETVYPGAPELCDSRDNDCNGKVDEAVVMRMYCEDKDGDGHGVTGRATKMDCAPSTGFGDCNGDCDDLNPTTYPRATELCNGYDDNCDGTVDEGVRAVCGTGWCRRYAATCTSACVPGPPIVEVCNAFDDDCDGVIDNGTDEELCGASGMTCMGGRCVSGMSAGGSGGANGSGGSDAGVDAAARDAAAGSGGAGVASGGTSGGEGRDAGTGGAGGSRTGGCAVAGALNETGSPSTGWILAGAVGVWWAVRRRGRR
jgi:hypothetical protein